MTRLSPCARFGLAMPCALSPVLAGCDGGGSTTTAVDKTVTVTQPPTSIATSTSAQMAF